MRIIQFLLLIPILHCTYAFASISVDFTCQFTEADITSKTKNPIDKVLERMSNNDSANHWQECAIGGASALTFTGKEPRVLMVKEENCKPKVFKMSFTPGAPIVLSSNLNHRNTQYRRWNVEHNTKNSGVYTPVTDDKTAVFIEPSRYTLMWVGTCEQIHFTLTPAMETYPENTSICAR